MKRTAFCVLLVLCLLLGMVQPVLAEPADESFSENTEQIAETQEVPAEEAEQAATEDSQTKAPTTFTTSAAGIAMIESFEGVPVSSFGNSLQTVESEVNKFVAANNIAVNQAQFDALVDFVFNMGPSALRTSYRYAQVLMSGSYTDAELADAWCAWCHVGASVSTAILNRRIRDVKLFIYGDYTGNNCNPRFRYIIYKPNGGTMTDGDVHCYELDATYGDLETPTREGKYFTGWFTATSGGTQVFNSDKVTQHQTLYAHWSDNAPSGDPNEGEGGSGDTDPNPDLPELKTSEAGIQFIKDHEGFIEYAYWDISQWTIGYGTRCEAGEYPNGITKEEADLLLREMLPIFEETVDRVLAESNLQHTQAQYDALISFTYNLGGQWAYSKYNVYQYVVSGGYTEMEFVNAMGSWLSSESSVVNGLARRRIDEANLYLNGEYALRSNVYMRMVFNGVGGTPSSGYRYYKSGKALGTLPTAAMEGFYFLGWYDKVSGGTLLTESSIAQPLGNQTVYAQWMESDVVYTDVPPTAWYYDPIAAVTEMGIMNGTSLTAFSPNGLMSRAMVVTVLHRMAGKPPATQSHSFTDVADGKYYSDAVSWAYETGVVKGASATRFDVDGNVTREQLAAMLYRYAQYCDYDTAARAELSSYPDAARISAYAVEALQWAVGSGIMNGSDGALNPGGVATRAECATMLTRFMERYFVE
ncbi:MAG: S-layer homology domain-containing protein [Oscillospiraceae bacterium]|jgi:uncharacterized repeat protein (TIGR02543 family)|nr:S-layer homology domain-containing protein [Oscillospiraceae bacterium]